MSDRPTDEQVERAVVTGSVSHADARIEGARDPYCGDAIDEALRLIDGAGL